MDAASAPALPTEFDGYRLVRVLGRGAMGTVWLAHEPRLDRRVAIKVISDAAPSGDDVQRFLTEARAAARLAHPNVLSVFRAGTIDGRPYLATEYVEGQTLDRLPGLLPVERIAELCLGLARGLAAAHRRGVLHRDIKPANAMVSEEGEVKILDFGLAKLQISPEQREALRATVRAPEVALPMALDGTAAPEPGTSSTLAGSILGTPAYMAPECWRGEEATAQSDVYSLGATCFHLFCGWRWDLETGTRVDDEVPTQYRPFQGFPLWPMSVSEGATTLVFNTIDSIGGVPTLQVFDATKGTWWRLEVPSHVEAGKLRVDGRALSRDGRLLAFHKESGGLSLVDLQTRAMRDLDGPRPIHDGEWCHLLFSPDGQRVIAVESERILVFPVEAGSPESIPIPTAFRGKPREIVTVGDRRLAQIDEQDRLLLWDLAGRSVRTLGQVPGARWVRAATGGTWLAAAGRDGVDLWDLERLSRRRLAPIASSGAFSPDGQWLALGGDDGQVSLFRVAPDHRARVLHPEGDAVRLGDALALLNRQRTAELWTPSDDGVQPLPIEGPVDQIETSSSGRSLFVRSKAHGVSIWVRETGVGRALPLPRGEQAALRRPVFSADGRWLAVRRESVLLVFRLDEREIRLVHRVEGPKQGEKRAIPFRFDFSPDSRWLAAADDQGRLSLIEVSSGRPKVLGGSATIFGELTFSPRSDSLAAIEAEGFRQLRQVGLDGSELRRFGDDIRPRIGFDFSPDGRLLAAAVDGYHVQLMELGSAGKRRLEVATSLPGGAEPRHLRFAASGQLLFGSAAGSFLWDVPSGEGRLLRSPDLACAPELQLLGSKRFTAYCVSTESTSGPAAGTPDQIRRVLAWPLVDPPRDPDPLRKWLEGLTDLRRPRQAREAN